MSSFSFEDDASGLDLDIPCDTLVAIRFLLSQFPIFSASNSDANRLHNLHETLCPFALLTQIYASVPDRTIVDRELQILRLNGVVRVLQLPTQLADKAVVLSPDYSAQVHLAEPHQAEQPPKHTDVSLSTDHSETYKLRTQAPSLWLQDFKRRCCEAPPGHADPAGGSCAVEPAQEGCQADSARESPSDVGSSVGVSDVVPSDACGSVSASDVVPSDVCGSVRVSDVGVERETSTQPGHGYAVGRPGLGETKVRLQEEEEEDNEDVKGCGERDDAKQPKGIHGESLASNEISEASQKSPSSMVPRNAPNPSISGNRKLPARRFLVRKPSGNLVRPPGDSGAGGDQAKGGGAERVRLNQGRGETIKGPKQSSSNKGGSGGLQPRGGAFKRNSFPLQHGAHLGRRPGVQGSSVGQMLATKAVSAPSKRPRVGAKGRGNSPAFLSAEDMAVIAAAAGGAPNGRSSSLPLLQGRMQHQVPDALGCRTSHHPSALIERGEHPSPVLGRGVHPPPVLERGVHPSPVMEKGVAGSRVKPDEVEDEKQVVLGRFRGGVLKEVLEPWVSCDELMRHLSTAGREANDEDISLLMSAGFLIRREDVHTRSYWFSIPNVGSAIKHLGQGRRELLRIFRQSKYKEMAETQVYSKHLTSSQLGIRFHVQDFMGLGWLERMSRPSGATLKLIYLGKSV